MKKKNILKFTINTILFVWSIVSYFLNPPLIILIWNPIGICLCLFGYYKFFKSLITLKKHNE